MCKGTAIKITDAMISHGIISADRKVVCSWGMTHILDTLLNLAIYAVIGLIFDMLPEAALFTVSYILLRIWAGGYHASTPLRCTVISDFILIAALLGMRTAETNKNAFLVCTAVSAMILVLLMPVEDLHKPLDMAERKKYRRKGLIVLTFEAMASVIFYEAGIFYLYSAVCMAWQMLAAVLIMGRVKNCLKGGKEYEGKT